MKIVLYLVLSAGMAISGMVMADDSVNEKIRHGLKSLIPDVEIDSINETPVNDIYQVMTGPDMFYISGNGRFVFKGELLDLGTRRNLTEEVRSSARASLLEQLDQDDYIEFASDHIEHTIYVFTDVDCAYCRKLHQDVPELNKNGVAVRYLAYPRAGVNSHTGREMQAVWCADDRQQALTRAKNNEAIESKKCDSPVAQEYALGKTLGVRGTPAIYLENGHMLPGYMPPRELLRQINRAGL